MLTVDMLRQYGADVDEGLGRCMGKEDFYLRLVKLALEDTGFEKLGAAVESGDLRAGFEAAHALKGVLGNLSLTPLYGPVSEMTELLRAGGEADYASCLAQILAQRDRFKALCE